MPRGGALATGALEASSALVACGSRSVPRVGVLIASALEAGAPRGHAGVLTAARVEESKPMREGKGCGSVSVQGPEEARSRASQSGGEGTARGRRDAGAQGSEVRESERLRRLIFFLITRYDTHNEYSLRQFFFDVFYFLTLFKIFI